MKIHEYQAKELLARFGVKIPRGIVATTVDQAVIAAQSIGGTKWVVKAQIHAGGRGKGGGVKLASSLDGVRDVTWGILGMQLVTKQTGPEGQLVRKVLVTEATDIAKEYYVGIVLDRKLGVPVLMASAEGGVEIEEVAATSPEKVFKEPLDPRWGIEPYQGRVLAKRLGFKGKQIVACGDLLERLADAYLETDASLTEINPLVLTGSGDVVALDAKFSFDDNALYRHADLAEYRDFDEEDPLEVRASHFQLNYIKLDGAIGCMVNGAGLAMATLDIIDHFGGKPANFLDVGGGATKERVAAAFKIITADPKVKGILVNIFGGIMRNDVIAEGVIAAVKDVGLKVPLVVRLEGTNVELGKKIIADSGLNVLSADDLDDAAQKVVAAVKELA